MLGGGFGKKMTVPSNVAQSIVEEPKKDHEAESKKAEEEA